MCLAKEAFKLTMHSTDIAVVTQDNVIRREERIQEYYDQTRAIAVNGAQSVFRCHKPSCLWKRRESTKLRPPARRRIRQPIPPRVVLRRQVTEMPSFNETIVVNCICGNLGTADIEY